MAPPVITEALTDPLQKRSACLACTKAKRKCTKQLPACLRCRGKRHRCVYPMTRTVLSSSSTPDTPQVMFDHQQQQQQPSPNSSTSPSSASNFLIQEHQRVPELDDHAAVASIVTDPWFLTPSSWEINPSPPNDSSISYPDSGLYYFIDKLRGWLDQWIESNHCLFIHPRLYGSGTQLPDCLRDAYAAYQTYRSSSPTNKNVTLQIANASAKRLVETHALYDDVDSQTLDTLSHLSRTQALLIFQVIRLFDGDVRSRAEAQATSSTLVKWSFQLMRNAAETTLAMQDSPAPQQQAYPRIPTLQTDGTLASTWRAWLLSESIRRTWITATLTEAAFLIMKQGFSACPGSIAFSSKAGLWEAGTSHEWLSHVQGTDGDDRGFPITCVGVPMLLSEAIPSQVDDFTHALIVYGTGQGEWDDWVASAA